MLFQFLGQTINLSASCSHQPFIILQSFLILTQNNIQHRNCRRSDHTQPLLHPVTGIHSIHKETCRQGSSCQYPISSSLAFLQILINQSFLSRSALFNLHWFWIQRLSREPHFHYIVGPLISRKKLIQATKQNEHVIYHLMVNGIQYAVKTLICRL